VGPALETVADTQGNPTRTNRGAVPEHMADLYNGVCGNCTSSTERQVLAQLVAEYSDVFSRGDGDMGLLRLPPTRYPWQPVPLPSGSPPGAWA